MPPKFFKRVLLGALVLAVLLYGMSSLLNKLRNSVIGLNTYVEVSGAWLTEVERVKKQGGLQAYVLEHSKVDPRVMSFKVVSNKPEAVAELAAKLASPCAPGTPIKPGCLEVESHTTVSQLQIYHYRDWESPCIKRWDLFLHTWEVKEYDTCLSDLDK